MVSVSRIIRNVLSWIMTKHFSKWKNGIASRILDVSTKLTQRSHAIFLGITNPKGSAYSLRATIDDIQAIISDLEEMTDD